MADNIKMPRPGEAALQNMKLLKKESDLFKIPKVPKSKKSLKKLKVLDEDVYVEGIAKIIQRDFFPDLEKLKAQNDYLEALENKDYDRLREINMKYCGNRPLTEPYNSPATFDTPNIDKPSSPTASMDLMEDHTNASHDSQKSNEDKDITNNHSLDSFLSQHTSEDNESYDRVIALEGKKRSTKLASQFEAEVNSKALADAALALPSIDKQADQLERPKELDTWRYRAKNFIMYVPDGSGQPKPEKPELQHHNTRLHSDPFDHQKNKEVISAIAKTQEATVSGKIGVDGACVRYSLMRTPSPGATLASPLMTWGHVEGTPADLRHGTPSPSQTLSRGAAYRMLECGSRERLALQLAEEAAKRRRPTTPIVRTPTPSFRSNTERLASMSPAARKLAAKHLLSPRLKLTPSNMGIMSHSHTPKRTTTPKRALVTPNVHNKNRPSTTGSVNNSAAMLENNLTDNLLNINVSKRTRLKAVDFFK